MIKVSIEVDVPDDKHLYWLLDWLRTFDRTHEGCCRFRIWADGGNRTLGETVQMLEALGLDIKFAERKT